MTKQENKAIMVGAGGRLVVPREDFSGEIDDGAEVDSSSCIIKVRKPNRREWIHIYMEHELTTKLLLHKPNPNSIDTEHYFVDAHLRSALDDELKLVRIIPFYSVALKGLGLWPLSVNIGNPWHDSAAIVLRKDRDFLDRNVVRLISDKTIGRYHIRYKPVPEGFVIPKIDRDIGEILGDAIGEDHFIRSAEHPLYQDLTGGRIL